MGEEERERGGGGRERSLNKVKNYEFIIQMLRIISLETTRK